MRVLILEDIAETRDWLQGIITSAFGAADVEVAGMIRDARQLIETPGDFDLALLDLGLPDG